ncbi:hypothetical protein HF1_13740 [Mycoplasma haemofelis str. Langford 1]|uniref:Uncharacterized protein n=1 Tax=Mycoplasma haemofelis (strain Langford 1) TaxID=941640 RepID=E8ZJR1_MYCHL|nr:hypothetical protein [Mycoplasma haemofelis]CBY93382.1 hypothetical protein HF1_13740 [Mycoplasma haemofelis str. Langford 1]
MRVELSKDQQSLTFTKETQDLWKELVLFCRKMNKKVSKGNGLSRREIRNIGWCNNSKDGYIPVNKKMSKRSYWADLLVRAKYKDSDFKFWGELADKKHEYTAKLHDLVQLKGYYTENLMRETKAKCDVFRERFKDPKSKFAEKDIEVADLCRSSYSK